MLFDCHVHLDDQRLDQFRSTLRYYPVRIQIISNSTDCESSAKNLAISKEYCGSFAFVGIHPQSASSFVGIEEGKKGQQVKFEQDLATIDEMIGRASGIGEIGLDPKYGNREVQEKLFRRQLEMAERSGKPISIHTRDSLKEILERLSTYSMSGKVLLHWFTGSEDELSNVQSRGYYTSFGPTIIFSKRVGALVASSHADLLLAETDSPLSLGSLREVTPIHVASVIFSMAQRRGVSFNDVEDSVARNALNFLGKEGNLPEEKKLNAKERKTD